MRRRFSVLVSGHGSNLAALIKACQAGIVSHDMGCVISNKPQVLALEIARQASIPHEVVSHRDFTSREMFEQKLIERLSFYDTDYVVLAGFMRQLTPLFCRHYQNRIINVHPSLLPAFKGAHAIRDTLDYGAKISGASVHFVDEGLDNGAIISQASVFVDENENESTLRTKIQTLEHRLLPEAVELLCSNKIEIRGRKTFVPN